VQKFLPEGATMPTRGDRAITLGDLATHRSGLPRLPDNLEPQDPDNPYADYDEKRLLDFLARHELGRNVGEQYEYSNLATGLLGYVLARRAGMPYEKLIAERILKPLGMNDTGITLIDDMKKRQATGHSEGKPVKNWDIDALAGAGALRSTPRDMVRFLVANWTKVDSPAGKALAASYKDRFATDTTDLSMGLGWHIWNKHDAEIIWHNGGTGGFRSACGFRSDLRRGAVVLVNSDFALDPLMLHLLEPKFEIPPVAKTVAVAADTLAAYAGYYGPSPGGNGGLVMHVTTEDGRLFVQLTGQPKFELFAESEATFYLKVVPAKVNFERDPDGSVNRLILHQNGTHTWTRIKDYKPVVRTEVPVDAKILEQYVGRYELAPGIAFDVKLHDGRLRVQLTGQPRFPVFAESETRFFYKVVEAQLTFNKDDSGKVTSLILHQGGIDQTARKVE
jgi:CubicO group peptidase (beta-lactamase class C family)